MVERIVAENKETPRQDVDTIILMTSGIRKGWIPSLDGMLRVAAAKWCLDQGFSNRIVIPAGYEQEDLSCGEVMEQFLYDTFYDGQEPEDLEVYITTTHKIRPGPLKKLIPPTGSTYEDAKSALNLMREKGWLKAIYITNHFHLERTGENFEYLNLWGRSGKPEFLLWGIDADGLLKLLEDKKDSPFAKVYEGKYQRYFQGYITKLGKEFTDSEQLEKNKRILFEVLERREQRMKAFTRQPWGPPIVSLISLLTLPRRIKKSTETSP